MLEPFFQGIVLILIILGMVMLARKLQIAYPVVLVIGGLALSLIPGIPVIEINPELIFIIFLPPLLYEAAWQTSWKDFWRWRRIIMSFAFPIVIVTSFVVALVSSAVLPGFTMALGFLLGGIVSPPDAVSATTVLKHVNVPKRISVVLEGESLLNDASSLIVFRFALIAVDTGRFVMHQAAWSFLLVVVMGILIGVLVALVYYAIHRWLPTDPNIDIILTFTAPYLMYIAAEHFHFSGVLAVVSGGLFLASRSHSFLSHRSRLQGVSVWSTVGFVLNGLVFMLIGLELPVIVQQLGPVGMGEAIGYGVLITVVLIVLRMLCAIGASKFTVFISRFIQTADSRPGWRGPVIIGWAGMRGVVSLAAALSIPLYLSDGTPFPQRNLIIFITFVVILLTLVIQGITLPYVVMKVNMPDPDHYLPAAEQQAKIRRKLAHYSIDFMEKHHGDFLATNVPAQHIRNKYLHDHTLGDDSDENEQSNFRNFYLELLNHQRHILHEMNRKLEVDEEIIRHYYLLLDMEEEKLRMRYDHR